MGDRRQPLPDEKEITARDLEWDLRDPYFRFTSQYSEDLTINSLWVYMKLVPHAKVLYPGKKISTCKASSAGIQILPTLPSTSNNAVWE